MRTVLALIMAAASCGSPTGSDSGITIEGHVYARWIANGNAPAAYVDPVNGAVVATSLDASTTTTDATGHFLLRTTKGPAEKCTPYTVTVTAAGQPTYSLTGPWGPGPRNQIILLSPPNPEKVGC